MASLAATTASYAVHPTARLPGRKARPAEVLRVNARGAPRMRRGMSVRAAAGGGDDKGKGNDWDGAWSSLKKNLNLDLNMDQYVDRVDRPPTYDDLNEAREQIKQDERRGLDLVTSPLFTKAMYGVIAVVFFFMVVIIGPPPS